jgi:hypothetical protein
MALKIEEGFSPLELMNGTKKARVLDMETLRSV